MDEVLPRRQCTPRKEDEPTVAKSLYQGGDLLHGIRRPPLLATVLLITILTLACGSTNEAAETFSKVSSANRTLSIEEFLAVGFKKSKEYDVSGLTGAVAAFYGFWTPEGEDPVDYELRFYPSHQVAVENGMVLAEEVTGQDAAVTEDASTWKEGVRDRRTSGFTTGGGGGNLGVKYADFVVQGNLVMLCQGRDSFQSIGRCQALLTAIFDEE